ncbi:MAG: hypothetical protein M3R15_31490 [Acidobacteriota bacterium]|nr:hypothetical protein [Acidobacteriota bacterium]
MASQTTTAPKRTTPKRKAKTTTKTAHAAQKNDAAAANGDQSATRSRPKPTSEMTLEELSLRAYKMTYEQLHGSKKKKK